MGQYRFNDPQVEQTASIYTQQRLQGTYYEARYQAEQQALRGYVSYAAWAAALFCPLFFLAVMMAAAAGPTTWGFAYALFFAALMPTLLIAGAGLGLAQRAERACGLRGAGADLLWVECYGVGLPGLLLVTLRMVWSLMGH